MKKPNKLSLKASGSKLIHDLDALTAGISRYIGRKWDAEVKGWPESGPSEVNVKPEYVTAVKHGDLLPGNKETADYCGVAFSSISTNEAETPQVSGNHPYNGNL